MKAIFLMAALLGMALFPVQGLCDQGAWVASGFSNIQFSAVQGNWRIPRSIYTVRFRMAPGSAFPVHFHGSDEVLTVIQGTFVYQPGTSLRRTGGREITQGGVLVIPANTRHWGWANGQTIVQINGIGPHSVHVLKP